MMRRILIALIAVLALIMFLICNIASADNSARIAELQESKMRLETRKANYKEVVLMSMDEIRDLIRQLDFNIVAATSAIKELQRIDKEERDRLEAERMAAEEEAKKKAEEKAKEETLGKPEEEATEEAGPEEVMSDKTETRLDEENAETLDQP